MIISTADLCDQYAEMEHFQVAEPLFKLFGNNSAFSGQITTLKVFEDNVLVRKTLQQPVSDRVLVIDGGGSHRCALLGSNIAQLACDNGMAGRASSSTAASVTRQLSAHCPSASGRCTRTPCAAIRKVLAKQIFR